MGATPPAGLGAARRARPVKGLVGANIHVRDRLFDVRVCTSANRTRALAIPEPVGAASVFATSIPKAWRGVWRWRRDGRDDSFRHLSHDGH